jgi:hypothetical protein
MDGSDAGLIINQLLTTRDLAKARRLAAEGIGDSGDVAVNHPDVTAFVSARLPHRVGEKRSANDDIVPASTGTFN